MRLLMPIAAALLLQAAPAFADKQAQMAASPPTRETMQAMSAALADPRRAADRPRDVWRHPAQTLKFFKVDPGMTVVDYMPSGGWYTRVLVPFLGPSGRYIGLNPDVSAAPAQMKQYLGNLAGTLPAKTAEWTGVPAERVAAFNTDGLPAELGGKVDRVLIFREMHNLWRMNILHRELLAVRRLLKDDGLLGIEQHRAKPTAPAAYTDGSKGYLREKDVIALIEAHGFALVGKSEVNANPNDPANHPDGVWTLPPNYRLGDKDRARYTAIGESDRMTLLFRKRP